MSFSIKGITSSSQYTTRFGGVYIQPDIWDDRMTGVTFAVFPDDVFTGVRYKGQFAPSKAADEMTQWGSRGKTPEDRSTASSTLHDYRRLRVQERVDAMINDAVAGNIMPDADAERIRDIITRHNKNQVHKAGLPQNVGNTHYFSARQDGVNPFYGVEVNVQYGDHTYEVGTFEYRDPRNVRAIPRQTPLTVSGAMPVLANTLGEAGAFQVSEVVASCPTPTPIPQPPVNPPAPPLGEDGKPVEEPPPSP